jgi:hypothetical protein
MEYIKLDPKYRRRPRPKRAGWAAREVYGLLLELSAEFDLHGRLSPSYQDVDFLAEEWVNGDAAHLELARSVVAEGLPAALQSGLLVREGDELVIADWDKWYRPPKSNAQRQADFRERHAVTASSAPSAPPPAAGVTTVTEPPQPAADVTGVTKVTAVTEPVTSNATPHHSTPLHKEETHTSAAPTETCGALVQLPPEASRAAALQRLWNELAAPGLPRWRETSAKRRKAAEARLRERSIEGPSGWREVIERINASAFCRGGGKDGWRASPDWILQPDTAAKVLEGKYGGGPGDELSQVDNAHAFRAVADGEDLYAGDFA